MARKKYVNVITGASVVLPYEPAGAAWVPERSAKTKASKDLERRLLREERARVKT